MKTIKICNKPICHQPAFLTTETKPTSSARAVWVPRLFLFLLTLVLPMAAQAKFTYTVTNGDATITGYTGPGGTVIIPDVITNSPLPLPPPHPITFPVTVIGNNAFGGSGSLTNVTIPNSVINIENNAFFTCANLVSVTIPDSVTNIGASAFYTCSSLTNVTIGNSVTSIGNDAFGVCLSLTNVIIPNNVTTIGQAVFIMCLKLTSVTIGNGVTNMALEAFESCSSLQRVYFAGDAPTINGSFPPFFGTAATIYYLPGTIGWSSPFADVTAVLWNPQILTGNEMFGVRTNQFGFTISATNNIPVAVQACTNLAAPNWITVTNLTCGADGTVQFTDPATANQPHRYYRFYPE